MMRDREYLHTAGMQEWVVSIDGCWLCRGPRDLLTLARSIAHHDGAEPVETPGTDLDGTYHDSPRRPAAPAYSIREESHSWKASRLGAVSSPGAGPTRGIRCWPRSPAPVTTAPRPGARPTELPGK